MTLKRPQYTGRLHWFHWLIIALSLVLTLSAWYISKRQIEEKLIQRFEFQSQQLMSLVSERMSRYEDALRSGVAAIYSQDSKMGANKWQRFANTLQINQLYPGINGIGVIYYIAPDNLDAYLKQERQLRPDYRIYPAHNKSEYWPITYVEPVSDNAKAIGLDMAFENNRLTAAKKARDTNTSQITAPIVLVQDTKKTPGFLQYVPFYSKQNIGTLEEKREHFVGHVYAPFIMYKLIEGTLAQKNRQLVFSVYDGEDELYNEVLSSNSYYDPKPFYQKTITLDIYGRPWTFSIQTSQLFREKANFHQSTIILLVGLLIDALLLFLFITLSRFNKKATDLAEQMTKKLSVSEKYFRHIIEAAPCGMLIVNSQGKIETVNPHAATLLGYTEEELVGESVDSLVPDSSRDHHANYRDQFEQAPEQRRMGLNRDVHCLTKDGQLFPAEIGLARFDEEGGQKILATIIDISTNVEITDELKRSNKDLNDFAYVASHDLKAPLRGIIQLSSWIEEDIADFASDDTKNNLALLQNRTSRLENLLNDLLAYSRIGRNLGDIKSVDIKEMITVIFDLQEHPDLFKLVFDGEMPVFETLVVPLDVIFRNLIGNAVKHHDKADGTITIKAVEHSQTYEFSICDDGPGIPPDLQLKAFELFKTLKPRDEVEGSGMGLSIVQKMLEYHNCTIAIKSDGKRGTCFVFNWPKTIIL